LQSSSSASVPEFSETNHSKAAIETERPATTEQPEHSASAAAIPKLSKADGL
jgi:hypothetical protein